MQAFRRAILVRRGLDASLLTCLGRIVEADKNCRARPELQLGCRTQAALTVLQTLANSNHGHTQTTKILEQSLTACRVLQMTTAVSLRCCQFFVQADAHCLLFAMIRSCNRTSQHQELLR